MFVKSFLQIVFASRASEDFGARLLAARMMLRGFRAIERGERVVPLNRFAYSRRCHPAPSSRRKALFLHFFHGLYGVIQYFSI